MRNFDSGRKDVMLAYMYDSNRFLRYPKPCFAQRKVEGDRIRACFDPFGKVTLYSSGAKEKVSLPHIVKDLEQTGFTSLELDGEAYKHGMPHEQIRSICSRTVNLHPDHEEMEYHVFEVINNQPQKYRLSLVKEIFNSVGGDFFKHTKLVQSYTVADEDGLQLLYNRFVEEGYEGIIIRHPDALYVRERATTMMKLKPDVSDWFEIIGFEEESDKYGQPKDALGAIIFHAPNGEAFNSGTGPTRYQRELLWKHKELLRGKQGKVRFQALTDVREVPKMSRLDKDWLTEVEGLLRLMEVSDE